jgi:radical SAM superfamily enzyme YgiQ (UPF0313 family)
MEDKTDILLINPPMGVFKPDYFQNGMFLRFIQPAINPGILSIASYLIHNNISVKITDFSNYGFLDKTLKFTKELVIYELEKSNPLIVGISSTSVFDYLETKFIFNIVKKWNPDIICIAGGQNMSVLGEIALKDIKVLDAIVIGEGEIATAKLIHNIKNDQGINNIDGLMFKANGKYVYNPNKYIVDINELPPLRFDIYPNFQDYIPYVEESRGCSANCTFCSNKQFYKTKLRKKNNKVFERDLANAINYYGSNRIFAFTTSFFNRITDIDNFVNSIRKYNIIWTTQTRCDIDFGDNLTKLHDAGMFLINFGLESANFKILKSMNKTNNPESYLHKFSSTLQKIELIKGLSTCVNLILYPGDDRKSIQETLAYLFQHRNALNAIVINPAFCFPGSKLWYNPELIEKLGGKIVKSDYCEKTFHYPILPNKEFELDELGFFCQALEKIFTPNSIFDVELDYRDMESYFINV